MRILLIAADNDAYMHSFPLGIAYIASTLLKNDYEVVIYNQDMNHYSDRHLTIYLNNNKFDVVGVGFVAGYYQYKKIKKISKSISQSKNRPFYIIGGHGPSPEPEYFMKKLEADVVVLGEGEATIVDLLYALSTNKPLMNVRGIAFSNGTEVVINKRRPTIENIDDIPMPAYHLFPLEYYRLTRKPKSEAADLTMNILSARGCHYHCNFCYRMDKGYRTRSNESIIDEVKYLQLEYGINYIAFVDECLLSSIQRTESLCEDIIKAKLHIKWLCGGRLNYAKPDLLKLMKTAGCVYISYGIECLDDAILKTMGKGLTTEMIRNGIKATLKAGISPGFNIIFGNIGETKEILNRGVEFLLKYDDGADLRTIRPVIPYPGSPLYYKAIENGLLKDCEDFYENKHVNSDLLTVNFTDLSDEEFHESLWVANSKLIDNYFTKKKDVALKEIRKLYFEKNTTFRGFRH